MIRPSSKTRPGWVSVEGKPWRSAMQTRFARLSHHPVFPLLALLAANVAFYALLASAIA
jgi:hypothetical protein